MSSKLPLFPEQASTIAEQVDLLYFFLVGVSAFFAILIFALIIGLSVVYRRKSEDQVGADIHGSLALELFWTLIPLGLAMVMFIWGAKVYMTIARPPDNAMQVFVVGKQWMWKVQHMEGRREINQLHVPIGKPVKLTITSEDVIHSFYIPAFRVKKDAVPGRYNEMWFEATKPGTFHLFCAEYCGTEHSRMIGQVIAMEPAAYQEWLKGDDITAKAAEVSAVMQAKAQGGASAPAASAAPAAGGADAAAANPADMAKAGENLFVQKGCMACHMQAPGALGPNLAGVWGKERKFQDGSTAIGDEAYIRDSILNPTGKLVEGYQPVMPTFQGQLSEQEILQLIQYIKSLGQAAAPPAEEKAAPDAAAATGEES